MTTIHLILHSHIDPIWLWPWTSGLDMVLGTWRTACDLLDRNPELVYPGDGGWAYESVERADPALFERIARHVEAGRWELIGGWWVQPDCNLPLGDSFRRQIELGRRYFTSRFGRFPTLAFNPDSFGHSAALPAILREFGQDRYIMMRPKEDELTLPARLFHWRGHAGGPSVLTYRIANEYQVRPPMAGGDGAMKHFRASVTELPPGVTHTMCFIGVGDHGGGVTERMLQWCREHASAIDGARMIFSSPGRFFDAVAGQLEQVPTFTGELQHHAIGCYSVYRPIKVQVRRAEHLLHQAQVALRHDPRPEADAQARIDQAWRRVCFHQFHDTLGGTCIPSAYEQVHQQLGEALAIADDTVQFALRRRGVDLPADAMQRIVAFNASETPFDDWVEFEPWREYGVSVPRLRLVAEDGTMIEHQRLAPEALAPFAIRLLFPLKLAPGELRVIRLDLTAPEEPAAAPTGGLRVTADAIATVTVRCSSSSGGEMMLPGFDKPLSLPRLDLIDDPTDTWGHGIDRYPDGPMAAAQWQPARIIEQGPLRAALLQEGQIGDSRLQATWRVRDDGDFVELHLAIDWRQRHKVLKLTIAPPIDIAARFDGISEGDVSRPNDGRELPLRDRTLLQLADGSRLGVVCPDVFALDGTARRIRLTLLRSALMAHHRPEIPAGNVGRISDAGLHEFRFRFFAGPNVDGALLDRHALALQRPPVIMDHTHGMPPLVDEGFFNPQ
jgi:alpha-mannosidase